MNRKVIAGGLLVCMSLVLTGCFNGNNNVGNNDSILHVGYISYAPGFIVDPDTGEKSGMFYEVLEEIAKRNDITIKYTEEVTWSTLVEVLKTNRVQMIASPVWITEERERHALFSDPLYFSPVGTYVREPDMRFDSDISLIDDATIRIATIDGEAGQIIAKEYFPDANILSLPNTIDLSQLFLEVEYEKADVMFAEPIYAYEYMKNNPGKLKNITVGDDAIRNRPNSFMIKNEDIELQRVLNQGIQELQDDGTLDRIIDGYEPFRGAVTRITAG